LIVRPASGEARSRTRASGSAARLGRTSSRGRRLAADECARGKIQPIKALLTAALNSGAPPTIRTDSDIVPPTSDSITSDRNNRPGGRQLRSITALLAVTALVNAPFGMFVAPPAATPSRIVHARWGEFDQPRSSTFDPVAMLLAMTERASPR
jgi:hypothetical protein